MELTNVSKIGIIVVSTLLAFCPIIMWGVHFYKKHPEVRRMVIITFIAGALSVALILFAAGASFTNTKPTQWEYGRLDWVRSSQLKTDSFMWSDPDRIAAPSARIFARISWTIGK